MPQGDDMARLVWLLVLVLLLPGNGPAWAQSPGGWEVTVGFGGTYREGAWTCLTVDMTSGSAGDKGELSVPVAYAPSPQSTHYGRPRPRTAKRVRYVTPVDLPRQSHKRYRLYVPAGDLDAVYLRLGSRTEKRELKGLRPVAGPDPLLVVVGGDAGLLSFLSGTTLSGAWSQPWKRAQSSSPTLRVAHGAWGSLPDSREGWDGVDIATLGDANLSTAAETEALAEWVRLGGTLIVPGGAMASALADSPLGPLLPLDVTHTEAAPGLAELRPWVGQSLPAGPFLLARGSLRSGAEAVVGSKDRPLVAEWRVGSGRVVLTAFDLTVNPFRYWNGQNALWLSLLARAPRPAALAEGSESALSGLAAAVREGRLLSPVLIIVFLVGYLLVLGPGQYLLLRRRDRREYAWLVTPVIVAAFTLGAYFLSLGTRGGRAVMQRLTVIEAESGATAARGRAWVGLFSPRMATYNVVLGKAASAPCIVEYEEDVAEKVSVEHGSDLRVKGLALNMWSARTIAVESLTDLGKGLTIERAEWDGARLTVRARNGTPLAFSRCTVAGNEAGGSMAALAPGEVREFTYDASAPASLTQGGPTGRGPASGPASRPQPPERDLGMDMLQALVHPDTSPYTPSAPSPVVPGTAYLMAVCREPILPVTLPGHRARIEDATVVAVPLRVTLTPGRRVRVPAWLIKHKTTAFRSGPPPPGAPGSHNTALFSFRVPLGPGGGTATNLHLQAQYRPSSGPTGPPVRQVRVRHPHTQAWQPGTQLGPDSWALPTPEQLLGPDGRVEVEATFDSPEGATLALDAVVQAR